MLLNTPAFPVVVLPDSLYCFLKKPPLKLAGEDGGVKGSGLSEFSSLEGIGSSLTTSFGCSFTGAVCVAGGGVVAGCSFTGAVFTGCSLGGSFFTTTGVSFTGVSFTGAAPPI
ncbi:MAG: pentapeptide repeat-containing protein [Flavitalea sp.]